jgi:hypothetical protein
MTSKQSLIRSKSHQQNWGILARDAANMPFRKPDKLISFLQAQYQTARVSVKDKPKRPPADMIEWLADRTWI